MDWKLKMMANGLM